MRILSLFIGLGFLFQAHGQILTLDPAFPTVDDVVTITYDATKGNGALAGQSQVYCHAGLITSTSTSPTNWQYVQGNWGTADANVEMTNIGNNKHQITIDIDQFYGFPGGTEVLQLAFVFRNASGSIVGRASDGSDIYYDVYPVGSGLLGKIFNPENDFLLANIGDTIAFHCASNTSANLILTDNGTQIHNVTNNNVLDYPLEITQSGEHWIHFSAENGSEIAVDSMMYLVNPNITFSNPPLGTVDGLNILNDSTVIFRLFAPYKNNVHILGDFNNWTPTIGSFMQLSTDSTTWWIEINNLDPNQTYGYQYFVDGEMKIADPYSIVVLDENNDQWIDNNTYPNPHPYPENLTSGFVSVFSTNPTTFNWSNDTIQMPEKTKLNIYELLLRDFVSSHNYQILIDTLDYLDKLGINAIELMPPGEYENNESWGYNPSFHMALDKYYGTPEKFKEFVDSCHGRGIAVIVDMVLNHAFGQNPLVHLYWDDINNRPAANNPWFNAICPHEPYCWGYDLDHTRQTVQDYMDRINSFWLTEYHVDGFRFDYTKGFINSSANFSQQRIDLLKRMADTLWTINPDTYIILEHWADNNEEIQLSDYGMLLWGNLNYAYNEATMGNIGSSNVSWGIYPNRGWNLPHLVTFMESHDEERLMYRNLNFGNSTNWEHDTKDEFIALGRMQTAAVLLLSQPGPKMIWQFGELGYDISIDYPCRVCNKPILWEYQLEEKRKQLYDVYSAMHYLRNNFETFHTSDFNYSLSGSVKRMLLNNPDMNALVLTNFNVIDQNAIPNFQHTGTWYEYFSGDSLLVNDVFQTITLKPAEYRIYTDVKINQPDITQTELSIEEISTDNVDITLYPNPSQGEISLRMNYNNFSSVLGKIINSNGKTILESRMILQPGMNDFIFDLSFCESGNYYLIVEEGSRLLYKPFTIVR